MQPRSKIYLFVLSAFIKKEEPKWKNNEAKYVRLYRWVYFALRGCFRTLDVMVRRLRRGGLEAESLASSFLPTVLSYIIMYSHLFLSFFPFHTPTCLPFMSSTLSGSSPESL